MQMSRDKRIMRNLKLFFVSITLIVVTIFLLRSCNEMETVKQYYPSYSNKLVNILPSSLQLEDTRNIHVQWDMDSTVLFARMDISSKAEIEIKKRFPLLSKDDFSKRGRWHVCGSKIEWWNESLCEDSSVTFYSVHLPPPYEAALPAKGILAHLSGKIYFFKPPHSLK